MSKYAFMVYHREYDAFLTTLRELGVVHVKETNSVLDNAESTGFAGRTETGKYSDPLLQRT